ncbi:MAG: hypothetical protein WC726_03005 [Parcubacteria group bacterium]
MKKFFSGGRRDMDNDTILKLLVMLGALGGLFYLANRYYKKKRRLSEKK